MWRSLHNLPSTAQSFRDSQDKSSAFHGASSAAWAKAPAVPLDWPISAVASAIDRGRPAGRWPACRPFHRSGAAAPTATASPRSPGRRARPGRRRIRDGQPSVFHGGQSRVPEPRGAHAAQRRMRHRPAAPPGAWVGLAAEPAEAGGRPPIDGPLLRGPAGGLDGGVVARAAPAGEGPPDVGRLRQAADAGVREPAAAESGSAPIPSTAFTPPSGGCFPRANRPLRARRGRGGRAPNASPPCRESPLCARTGPARPPRARGGRARAPRPRDAHGRRGRALRPGA